MTQVILDQPGVLGLDLLQTRLFGAKIYVDAEIAAQADLPLSQAHAIAESVHEAIEQAFPLVKHCMVHVNPKQADPASPPGRREPGSEICRHLTENWFLILQSPSNAKR